MPCAFLVFAGLSGCIGPLIGILCWRKRWTNTAFVLPALMLVAQVSAAHIYVGACVRAYVSLWVGVRVCVSEVVGGAGR